MGHAGLGMPYHLRPRRGFGTGDGDRDRVLRALIQGRVVEATGGGCRTLSPSCNMSELAMLHMAFGVVPNSGRHAGLPVALRVEQLLIKHIIFCTAVAKGFVVADF